MDESGISDVRKNPFAVHSPDALETVPANYIVNLFVEEYTRLPAIEQQKHTFIWGLRGSGKSFILRYMEPRCQEIRFGSLSEFFEKDDSFIGIYFPCNNGQQDKTELDKIEDDYKRQAISEHLLNVCVAEETISSIVEQIPSRFYSNDDVEALIEDVLHTLDAESLEDCKRRASLEADKNSEPLEWLRCLFKYQRVGIEDYLKELAIGRGSTEYKGSVTSYHNFILPFFKKIREMVWKENLPIYLLVDDAFYLREHQQRVINTWIGNRDQAYLCVKVSSVRSRYDTYETKEGDPIEETHDFSEVGLDEQYTVEHSDYSNKVKRIANRRLEIAEVPTKDVKEFLPASEYEQDLLEQIRKEMREEWEENQGPGESVTNYVDKNARARLHQRVAENKASKSYAGFDYLVHISSGRIRDFLNPCHTMFEKCVERGNARDEIEEIPVSIQNDIIKEFSRELLQDKPKKIRKDLDADERSTLEKLMTLVKSLGDLFHERLHDEDHREPRVFSFSVRGVIPPDSDIHQVLELGTERGYFTLHTAPSKEGGGGEELYILNRRLAPVFTIDPSSFRGRIPLDHQKLKVACEDPDEFVRVAHGIDKKQESLDDFMLDEGNES